MTTQLTAHRQDEAVAITGPQPGTGLPTLVLWLGRTLTVEIDPAQEAPVRLDTEDYSQDRRTVAAILGAEAAAALDDAADDQPIALDFLPGADWANVRELALQQWTMEWNPLPHDRALLALDIIRAQHAAIHLTGNPPSARLLDAAYPAARALQRLLDTDGITPTARSAVQQSLDAFEASTPLDYTPQEQPYTLPLPLTQEEIHTVLDPAPVDADAVLVGSPDWRLVGNGPAATAENAITVRAHPTRSGALTVSVPASPHTDPSSVPSYQALITDPETRRIVAAATLAFIPATNAYTGHAIPHRPITPSDVVDIRTTTIAQLPWESRQDRASAKSLRQAVRAYVSQNPAPLQTLTALAQNDQLLATLGVEASTQVVFVDFLSQAEYVRAAKSEHSEQTGSAELGSIGASWTIDASGTSLHLTVDAEASVHPPLSGVRIRLAAEDREAVYLMPFATYDSDYVVSELTVPLPPQGFTVSIDASRIDFSRLAEAPQGLLMESIHGAGRETLEAWKSIARLVPGHSAFGTILAQILDVQP